MTRPETADLTSTLMSGSTTPTSRTLTWRSSDCTLPRRNGDSSTSGFDLVVARATTRVPPTSTTAAPAITHLFLRICPSFFTTAAPGRFFRFGSERINCLPLLSTQEGGKRLQGEGGKKRQQGRQGQTKTVLRRARFYRDCSLRPGIEIHRIPYLLA